MKMINSMTGFGRKELEMAPCGKICVELRSANHKFLEIVIHLPDGLLSLEDRIKKAIEAKVKRGRLTCVVSVIGGKAPSVFINKPLLKNYIALIKEIKKQFQIKDEISINTLMQLPGALSLDESQIQGTEIWPRLKLLLHRAVEDLVKTRQKEGRALQGFLRKRAELLKEGIGSIRARFKQVVKEKINQIKTDEERSSFLKDSDITEEIERLTFHIRNFKNKLAKNGPVGKELDFIAQEMQREANTLAAKSFDTAISAKIIQAKSQVEKIREQVQNIE